MVQAGTAIGVTPVSWTVLGLGVKPMPGVFLRRLWVSHIPELNVCDVDYTTPRYTRRVPVVLPGKCESSGGRAVRILLWRRNSRTLRCQSSLRRILWRDGHRPSCSAGQRRVRYTAIPGRSDGSRPWDDAATGPYLGHPGPVERVTVWPSPIPRCDGRRHPAPRLGRGSRPGRNVGDVGHLELIGCKDPEVPNNYFRCQAKIGSLARIRARSSRRQDGGRDTGGWIPACRGLAGAQAGSWRALSLYRFTCVVIMAALLVRPEVIRSPPAPPLPAGFR